jgi:hypothetical protein
MNQTRLAAPGDAGAIVALLRAGVAQISTGLLERAIYSCHGYETYLRDLIECQPQGENTFFYVHTIDGAVAGYMELRKRPGVLFISQVFVRPEHRHRFLYYKLAAAGLSGSVEPDCTVLFDTPGGNERVLKGYLSMGAVPVEEVVWVEGDLGEPFTRPVTPCFSGLAESLVLHQRYGFSRFEAITPAGAYVVGRLGERFFRCSDLALTRDREALGMLRGLGAGRKLLCITTREALTRAQGEALLDLREAQTFQRLKIGAAKLHSQCLPFCAGGD